MLRNHTVLSRLRAANPHRLEQLRDDRLKDHIVSLETGWEAHHRPIATARGRKVKLEPGPKSRLVAIAVALSALALSATGLLSGSETTIAQAFPVLSRSTELTPVALQESPTLKAYGVSRSAASSLNIEAGHPVETRWGTGYVLESPQGFLCIVAPGLSSADWGASCAPTDIAASKGTPVTHYARDDAKGTARVLGLLPQGASATMRIGEETPQRIDVRDGVLATNITSPAQIAITTDGETRTFQVSPETAAKAPDPTDASTGSESVVPSTAVGGR